LQLCVGIVPLSQLIGELLGSLPPLLQLILERQHEARMLPLGQLQRLEGGG
jgi:hypothetical protein